jgi:hypothetical protein
MYLPVQRLLQHKVAQHHLLQTSTLMVAGTPRVSAKRPDKLLSDTKPADSSSSSSKPGSSSSSSKAQVQAPRLSTIEVASIKIEPKALMRRPPSTNSMRNPDGTSSGGQQQQQRKKTHKEREAGVLTWSYRGGYPPRQGVQAGTIAAAAFDSRNAVANWVVQIKFVEEGCQTF